MLSIAVEEWRLRKIAAITVSLLWGRSCLPASSAG